MSESTIKPGETNIAAAGHTESNTDPTAKILGDFRRELLAQGFGPEQMFILVKVAAEHLLHRGALVADGRSKPEGGAA